MKRFWAIDYVDENECELVVNGQLFLTELDAIEDIMDRPNRDNLEVSWYTIEDLRRDVYDMDEVHITPDLQVRLG
jgi:hypothetical protein